MSTDNTEPMDQSSSKGDKPFKGKFQPRNKPIAADAPSRQEIPTPAPLEKTLAATDSLEPKSKNKPGLKRSEPRNEPLEIPETMVLGLSGLALRPGKLHYRHDASGYIDLIRATYVQYNALDRYFERTISPAMFDYYCMCAYWKRCYQILFDSGRDTNRTYRQLQAVFPDEFVLPAPISAWLSGIGNFTDPSGRRFELDLVEPNTNIHWDGFRGTFGQIGPNTVQHYANSISPFVIMYRLYAENCANGVWVDNHYLYTMPGHLEAGHGGLPNSNLLGWAPLIKPHPDISRQLHRLRIHSTAANADQPFVTIEAPHPRVRGIHYIPDLVEHIAGKLSTYKEIKLMHNLPLNQIGSSVQTGWIETPAWLEDGPYPRQRKVTTTQMLVGHPVAVLGKQSNGVWLQEVTPEGQVARTGDGHCLQERVQLALVDKQRPEPDACLGQYVHVRNAVLDQLDAYSATGFSTVFK